MSIGSNKIFDVSNELAGKLRSMPNRMETLAAFIARIRAAKNLTFSDVSKGSNGAISPNYVHNLEKGAPAKSLGGDKIVAIAKGLGAT